MFPHAATFFIFSQKTENVTWSESRMSHIQDEDERFGPFHGPLCAMCEGVGLRTTPKTVSRRDYKANVANWTVNLIVTSLAAGNLHVLIITRFRRAAPSSRSTSQTEIRTEEWRYGQENR